MRAQQRTEQKCLSAHLHIGHEFEETRHAFIDMKAFSVKGSPPSAMSY